MSFEQASILATPKIQRKEDIAGSIHNTPVAGAARPRHHIPRFSIGRTYGMHWRHETTLSIFCWEATWTVQWFIHHWIGHCPGYLEVRSATPDCASPLQFEGV